MLLSQFADRRDVLKARSALLGAGGGCCRSHPVAGGDVLASELERIRSGAHELTEIRLLNALRASEVKVPAEAEEMERLLGAEGGALHIRLGLEPEADASEVRRALQNVIGRWQRRAESPMSSREVADAARVVIRTCEGLLVSLG